MGSKQSAVSLGLMTLADDQGTLPFRPGIDVHEHSLSSCHSSYDILEPQEFSSVLRKCLGRPGTCSLGTGQVALAGATENALCLAN